MKLAARTLTVLDYYTPANWAILNAGDLDLGCAGCFYQPGSFFVVSPLCCQPVLVFQSVLFASVNSIVLIDHKYLFILLLIVFSKEMT